MNRIILIGYMGAAIGCAPAEKAAAPETMRDSITVQMSRAADSEVSFTIAGGFAGPHTVDFVVASPVMRLHNDARGAVLDELTLPLGDAHVPGEAFPPNGLVLRNLVLRAEPARAEVQADDLSLSLSARVSFVVDWSMQLDDGTLYPLSRVRSEPVDLHVDVVRSGAAATVTADGKCAGSCWSLDGIASLSDASLHLDGAAEVNFAR
jgi:hypothetical protein